MASYKCLSTCDKSEFCFVCAHYVPVKRRVKFNANLIQKYKKAYNVRNLKNFNKKWTPNIACGTCYRSLNKNFKDNSKLKYQTPAIWKKPNSNHSNCFICQTNLTQVEKRHPEKYDYRRDLSVKLAHEDKKNVVDVEDSDDDEIVENGKANDKSSSESEQEESIEE